jgi:hypothetical protein
MGSVLRVDQVMLFTYISLEILLGFVVRKTEKLNPMLKRRPPNVANERAEKSAAQIPCLGFGATIPFLRAHWHISSHPDFSRVFARSEYRWGKRAGPRLLSWHFFYLYRVLLARFSFVVPSVAGLQVLKEWREFCH